MTTSRICLIGLAASITWMTGCSGQAGTPATEPATLNVTSWTDKTELYMEYPALVAGQTALFAVHLTQLADFKPLNAGRPSLEFIRANDGEPVLLTGSPPSRPGAFRVEAAAPSAGTYKWALLVNAPDLMDRHELGEITVFPDQKAASTAAEKRPADDPAAIAYLKEQQWTNEFATAQVQEADVRTSIRVPATIEPLPGGEAIVEAPAPGRFTAKSLISIGEVVRDGQALGQLEPRLSGGEDRATLAGNVAEAQAVADAAKADQARAERLVAERAVPARRLEEAQRAVAVAEARLRAAQARLAQRDETLRTGSGAAAGNTFTLRAPLTGRVADVWATLGASYDEGEHLFRIVRTDRVELQALVPAADAASARSISSVTLEVPGRAEPIALQPDHVHDSGVIDSTTRALVVQMEVPNPGGRLLVGQSGTALLYTGSRERVPAVPKAAVLMEAGRPYVFAQISGERFARRFVEIVARDGDLVGIRSGVTPGDRVVTRGAYEVQLASAAKGLPAEGHVH
jgi:membrane fusion protein, heavy metal efflux system